MNKKILIVMNMMIITCMLFSAVPLNKRVWIRVGSLQSQVDAWGAERGWNANSMKYVGLQWPAWSDDSDNFVIDRPFMACRNFITQSGDTLEYKSVKFSAYANTTQIIPQMLEQSALYSTLVRVDGVIQQADDSIGVFHLASESPADRIVTNIVRTGMGVTMTRRVYAFSHPDHDNYLITEYIFMNTGHIDDSDEIKLTHTLEDFYFGIITRYATSGELAHINYLRQGTWGAHQWVHHTPMKDDPELPYYYSWLGQGQTMNINLTYNNIGGPFHPMDGPLEDARLRCPQFAGKAVLHADGAYNNTANDKNKIRIAWYIGDALPSEGADQQIWELLNDNYLDRAFPDIAQDVYAEHKLADRKSPYSVIKNVDAAGTNAFLSFGPYDIPHGGSIKIVVVEGVSGLSLDKSIEVGKNWYMAYNEENPELILPPAAIYREAEPVASGASEMDIYKDMWVYTGKDSIVQTFLRAKEMYDSGFDISVPPPPPSSFELTLQSGQVIMEWDDNSTQHPDFEGYRIYRAMHQRDSSYHIIFDCNVTADNCTTSYIDEDILPNVEYYYYVVAYKSDAERGELESGRAYTQTNTSLMQVGIKEIMLPKTCVLKQNYPNPFNPTTTLQYGLPEAADVDLMIFDITGRKIKAWSIVNQQAGWHEVIWNGTDKSGALVPTGVYIYSLRAGNVADTKKMVFMK